MLLLMIGATRPAIDGIQLVRHYHMVLGVLLERIIICIVREGGGGVVSI